MDFLNSTLLYSLFPVGKGWGGEARCGIRGEHWWEGGRGYYLTLLGSVPEKGMEVNIN